MILDIVSTNIFFPLGKMIGMVRLRTGFVPSSQSWEISSPTGSATGRMRLSCVMLGHTHLTNSCILKTKGLYQSRVKNYLTICMY